MGRGKMKGKIKILKNGRLKIHLAVKGLVRDGENAADLIKAEMPDIVALGVAPEELDGMRQLMESDEEYDPDLSNIDMAYAEQLTKYGDVEAPPPCFTRAIMAADEAGIKVVALDLGIAIHTDIYVENVLFSDILRQSMKFRSIKKRDFKMESPEDFVIAWDNILNKAEGFSIVEGARVDCMAKALRGLLEDADMRNIVAIIEIERAGAVIENLIKGKATRGHKKKRKRAQ